MCCNSDTQTVTYCMESIWPLAKMNLLPVGGFDAQASCCHFIEKRRVIIAATGLIDPPRHRPHAKATLRGWPKKLCAILAAQPRPDIRSVEHRGHAIVNRPRQLVRIRDDDRA